MIRRWSDASKVMVYSRKISTCEEGLAPYRVFLFGHMMPYLRFHNLDLQQTSVTAHCSICETRFRDEVEPGEHKDEALAPGVFAGTPIEGREQERWWNCILDLSWELLIVLEPESARKTSTSGAASDLSFVSSTVAQLINRRSVKSLLLVPHVYWGTTCLL